MNGSIPVLSVQAQGLAMAWEQSLVQLYERGCTIRTEYDAKGTDGKYLDPPSRDCTMMMTVVEPSSEPLIHRAFPGGLEDLEEYRQEVIDGIKDHWVRDGNDHDDERWEYTYHDRITRYPDEHRSISYPIDQLDDVVKKLVKAPISRRAQAITWVPSVDLHVSDPPCLQSIWCRILPDEDGVWHLNMNVRFRSRDAYDAAFMNCFALICLQEDLARRISEKADREVRLGHYCDVSDSYHIYGRRIKHFEDNFLSQRKRRYFGERTWTREDAEEFFVAARPAIVAKVARYDKEHKHG